MVAADNTQVRTRMTYFTRSRLFMWLAFALLVIAAFVGGGILINHNLNWEWLVAGAGASYILASLE
jgi:hypothetical protein